MSRRGDPPSRRGVARPEGPTAACGGGAQFRFPLYSFPNRSRTYLSSSRTRFSPVYCFPGGVCTFAATCFRMIAVLYSGLRVRCFLMLYNWCCSILVTLLCKCIVSRVVARVLNARFERHGNTSQKIDSLFHIDPDSSCSSPGVLARIFDF